MRFELIGTWKDGFEHDGLLYCAQRMEEMLMHFTSHIYKAPALNSLLLALEYMDVYDQVSTKIIDTAHLKNILEEFIDSFSSDIVVSEFISQGRVNYYVTRLNRSSEAEQYKIMHYLLHELSDYPKWCGMTLAKYVKDPKQKKKIDKVLRCFIPTLIGFGYNPEYLHWYCKKIFSNTEINNLDSIYLLIDLLEANEKTYTVYIAIGKKIKQFRRLLETRLDISFDNGSSLKYDRDQFTGVKSVCTALDPNNALRKTFRTIDVFMRYYRFLGNRDEEEYYDMALIKSENGSQILLPMRYDRYWYSQNYDDITLSKQSDKTLRRLVENTWGNTLHTIDKAVEKHNTALACRDLSNGFLSFWSIFEIISSSDGNEANIQRVLKCIVPVLCRCYIKSIVEEMHDYLKANLPEDQYQNIMDEISEGNNENEKIAMFLASQKYTNLRETVCRSLNCYPIIRNRVWQAYHEIFKSKRKVKKEISRYRQRITWHIQRLYRLRNSIIHSGNADANIRILIEHLHSYVDDLLLEIIRKMTQKNNLVSIDDVFIEAQVELDILEAESGMDIPLNEVEILKLLN